MNDIIEDPRWLSSEDTIESYFKDVGREHLDCGQGYYEDEATVMCKIGDDYYEVSITAEIGSAKQDWGDRLYWVEKIESVTYTRKPTEDVLAAERNRLCLAVQQTEVAHVQAKIALNVFDRKHK